MPLGVAKASLLGAAGSGGAFTAVGGIIHQYSVSSVVWRSHTFRGSGKLVLAGAGAVDAEWLVLGAGGDGIQGGGGAGGVRQYDKTGEAGTITLNGGTTYTVTVGTSTMRTAVNGEDSVFAGSDITDITALGGGKGGSGAGSLGGAPGNGGSGGGGGTSVANTPQPGTGTAGPPLQGRNGGAGNVSVAGGGGGGYGSVGVAAASYQIGGDGGTGGTLIGFGATTAHTTATYAGGGGGVGGVTDGTGGSGVGGAGNYGGGGLDAVPNTGSGGGSEYGSHLAGGLGSAGIVIIRYEIPT